MMKFIGFLVAIAAILGVVGWAAGWWTVRTVQAGDETSVRVDVDKGEIRRDMDDARAVVNDTVGGVKPGAVGTLKEARGEVRTVDAAGFSIAVVGTTTQRFELADGVEILERSAKVDRTAISTGDRVVISFEERDGKTWAKRIVIEGAGPR